jgi:hypothetical protein
MTNLFIPIPVFLGDTFGSTLAVMLFPDDMSKARAWHARQLSKGALRAYLAAGHSFEDRLLAFADAVGAADVDDRQISARLAGAGLAADVFKVLWALICDECDAASWSRAITIVCDATSTKEAGSPAHIRKQLKRFAPVMHLWLGWQLSENACPSERELFNIGYPILFAARAWAASRPAAYQPSESYLSVKEYGPWPQLAEEMQRIGGGYLRQISLSQPV